VTGFEVFLIGFLVVHAIGSWRLNCWWYRKGVIAGFSYAGNPYQPGCAHVGKILYQMGRLWPDPTECSEEGHGPPRKDVDP
jgi:hypothetical protein